LTERPIEMPVEGLTDGKVRVRLGADADVPAIVEACQDEAIQRYTSVPWPYGEADARSFQRRSAEAAARGRGLEAVVVDASSGRFLGTVGVRRHAVDAGRWDLGYLVAPWARRRGVATRATRLICRYAFDELGAERIEICAEPENEASQRVALRAGFTREGVLRDYQPIKGVRRDMVMHSLLRRDWADPSEVP
jgi:RimJ/RimL family protein N-acetyltransferase